MTRRTAKRILLAGALTLGLLLALNWQGIMLALAMIASEKRPSLLADAEWNKPQSAVAFNRRFLIGVSARVRRRATWWLGYKPMGLR